MESPAEAILSVKYLNQISKAAGLSEMVTIQMADDMPVLVEYKLGELGYLRFYIAPKVDEDEEGAPGDAGDNDMEQDD
jgi:proliferating cell nuclear antigen